MSWDETHHYIRSGHKASEDFEPQNHRGALGGKLTSSKSPKHGEVRWTTLEKKVLTKCHSLATRTCFDNRLRYLLKKQYIQRANRGIYQITPKATKYMEVI